MSEIATTRDESGGGGNTGTPPPAKKQTTERVYWTFTWNNYSIIGIEMTFKVLKHECDWIIMQEETGASGNHHIQGTLKLKKAKRLTQMLKFHREIHWEATIQISSSCCYCSNIDKRTGKIWTHNFEIEEEIECKEPYGWQLKVMEIINAEVDKRHIHWFWEPNGNVGKSTLVRYLAVKHKAIPINGKTADIQHVASKYAGKSNLFVCNIPKCSENFINYQALEILKDGVFMSGKYDGKVVIINYPHVIVFANIEPDRDKMTNDKYLVFRIELN